MNFRRLGAASVRGTALRAVHTVIVEPATVEELLAAVTVLAGGALVYSFLERRERRRVDRASQTLARSKRGLERRLEELDEDHRAMQTVLSSMQDGVVLLGPVGGIRLVNAAAERYLGARPATLAGLLPVVLQQAARRASSARTPCPVEVETGTPSRWLRGEAVPVGDDGSVLLVLRDVTDAKRIDAMRRDLVANASHELKTPAASIQAAAETIRTAAADDPAVVSRFAKQLEREAIRLSRIVSDLLDLSRLETGSDLTEHVDLAEVLLEEEDRFEEAAREAEVTLTVEASRVRPMRGSARDLALMVRNLVDNAIRYTRPGGHVHVTLRADDAQVLLAVADTGIGIPSRELPRIFERFYRVDRARSRETGGTGLGLSIVKHIVENHGGTISVESELGRGSSFQVRLPAAT